MKERLMYLLRLAGFMLVYFFIARLYFELYEFNQTTEMSLSGFLLTFVYGLRLDLSITGYIMLLFSLITILSLYVPGKWFKYVADTLLIILVIVFSLIIVTDGELYRHWGYRMDTTPLGYLKNPDLAMASTPVWLAIVLVVGWLVYSFAFIWVYLKYVAVKIQQFKPIKWYLFPWFILVSGCMILPIRGSLGIAPINTGMVYFSNDLYTNHAAINVVWNFFYDVANNDRTDFSIKFMPKAKADSIRQSIIVHKGEPMQVLKMKRPNVLFLILESFSAKTVGVMGGKPHVTPNINRLWHEGLAFPHILATGMRSDRGLAAVLSGYPSHPYASVMKYPQKTQKLLSVCQVLKKQGYQTAYYYGGDTNFANMHSYLMNSGFQRVVDEDYYPVKDRNAKWGVQDEFTFNRLLAEIDTAKQPFYKAMFTISSHEPFDVPMKTVIKGNDSGSKYLNAVFYTDSCIGQFIKEAKQKAWWDSTLIVLVADHSVRYPNDLPIDIPERYTIPMLWLGGAVAQPGIIEKRGNQYDIPATVLKQMGLPVDGFVFSSDILSDQNPGYSMYIYNQGYGYVTDKGSLSYDFKLHKFQHVRGDTTGLAVTSEAMFQSLIDHFNSL